MQALSSAILELYECADNVGIHYYGEEAVRIVRKLIGFDGAVLGYSGFSVKADRSDDFEIQSAYVHERDQLILADYSLVSSADPITASFTAGLSSPISIDCEAYYKALGLEPLLKLIKKHDISNLMLFGDKPDTSKPVSWVTLYRSDAKTFGPCAQRHLSAIWPHVSRAIVNNRRAYLDKRLRERDSSAVAFINALGVIEYAEPDFDRMLRLEWAQQTGRRVPQELLRCALSAIEYRGKRICVRFMKLEQYFVYMVKEHDGTQGLTPAELAVAVQYAQGANHKSVASNLGISQNTVRSHLAHIYNKLQIHNKVELSMALLTKR